MQTSEFHYDLPRELIAQQPLPERTQARMLVVRRRDGSIIHRRVLDLPEFLNPDDLLLVNDTRVFPARVFGRKAKTGGTVEILLIEETADGAWEAFLRSSRSCPPGTRLSLAGGKLDAEVVGPAPTSGRYFLKFFQDRPLPEILEEEGVMPLPPYIRRPRPTVNDGHGDECRTLDRERYQTVYARATGAIAAPTAGLHFTLELLAALEQRGIRRAAVTLHVGPGTFKPVKTDRVEDHRMEAERFIIPAETARLIGETRARRGRVVAVGSTVVRTLENAAAETGAVAPAAGRCSLFIYPPFRFRAVDALLTNFHLPRSTLLMMVSAFAGRDLIQEAYRTAVRERYRFYSYGDCMLIL